MEIEKALEELRKLGEEDVIYKNAGPLLIKTKKTDPVKDLEEKKELSKTRLLVLGKQEARVKENLKEVETKINEMIRIGQNQRGTDLGASGTSSVPGN